MIMNLHFFHGALGSAIDWKNVTDLLPEKYTCFRHEFSGHGLSERELQPNLNSLVDELAGKVNSSKGKKIVIGYSMGGYVALQALIEKKIDLDGLICLAVKYNWSEEIAEKECAQLSDENWLKMKPFLEKSHHNNIHTLQDDTHSILKSIGNKPITDLDLSSVDIKTLVVRGDSDKMVTKEEAVKMNDALPNSHYLELPETGHLLGRMDSNLLCKEIINFIDSLDSMN